MKAMTEGNEGKTIVTFALPIMGANLLQVAYNVTDSMIVGNYIGANALGAVGLTGSLSFLLVVICSGLGTGTSIAVSQFFGAKEHERISEISAASFCLAIALGIFLPVICILSAGGFIGGFLQTPENMKRLSVIYFSVYCIGIIFQLLYNVAYGILRAHGDSRGAILFLLVSSVLNIILDCVFVILCGFGVAGAAAATVIAQAGAAAASLLYLKKRYPGAWPGAGYLYAWREQVRLLLRLSIPVILQSAISAIGFIILQRLINSLGTACIEGYAAMQKIEQFAHIPSNALNAAISSFAGQNIGAAKLERVRRGYRRTIFMGAGASMVLGMIVILLGEPLLAMFNIQGESLLRGKEHLDLLMIFIPVNTVLNITCGLLQGAGDVKIPAVSGFVNLGIRLVLSYLLARTAVGVRCYYVSMPPAWFLACGLVVARYRSGKWKECGIV